MSKTKDIDTSSVKLSSAVFPTEADMKLWESLTAQERRALILRDEEAGFRSGPAPRESLEERLVRVRAKADAV